MFLSALSALLKASLQQRWLAAAGQVETTNKFLCFQLGVLATLTVALGPWAMFNLYFMPCE